MLVFISEDPSASVADHGQVVWKGLKGVFTHKLQTNSVSFLKLLMIHEYAPCQPGKVQGEKYDIVRERSLFMAGRSHNTHKTLGAFWGAERAIYMTVCIWIPL